MAAPLPNGSSLQNLQGVELPSLQGQVGTAEESFAAINSGLDLGQRLLRLQDTQQQIKLEQLKRKSDMAQLAHAQALAEAETAMIPQVAAAQKAAALATTAAQENELARQQALARLQVPTRVAEVAGLTAGNEAAKQGALASLGVPGAEAKVASAQAQNALTAVEAAADFSKLSPVQQESAKQIAALGIAPKAGEALADYLQRGGAKLLEIKTTQPREVERVMPDGSTHKFLVPTNAVTGEPKGEGHDLGPTGRAPSEVKLERDLPVINNLLNVKKQAQELLPLLEAFKAKHKGFLKAAGQSIALRAANTETTSLVKAPFQSVARLGGQAMLDKDTQVIAAKQQGLSAPILQQLIGSAMTATELQRLNSFVPTNDDLTDPESAITKVKNLIDVTEEKLKTYSNREASKELFPGRPTAPEAEKPRTAATSAYSRSDLGKTVRSPDGSRWMVTEQDGVVGLLRISGPVAR